jgi:4-carboxymuconolactone decarboxylase
MKHLHRLSVAAALAIASVGLISAVPAPQAPAPVPQNATEKAALEVMEKIGWGTNAATRELDEDLWHIINQANLGLIWSRPGLSLRERELIVMSVLVAIGSPGISHVMQHADAVGITDEQIKELILQTLPYSGQPNAIQAMVALKRMQAERKPAR